jgi:hypothetical protein
LSKQPLCQACMLLGRIVGAVHVDHVIAWKPIGPHAFINSRFQSLCGPCHSVKTGLEQRGIFRHYKPGGAVDYSLEDWGRMMSQPDTNPAPPRD